MSDLSSRSVSAVLWGGGGSVLRLALQIGAQAVLARLLGPTEYGVFAIGSIVISFSAFFADVGLAYGLIQKREVSDQDVRFAFTWQFVIGLLVSLVLVGLSGVLADFFGEPRAKDVICVMSLICLVNAIGTPAGCLLKRSMDFKTQQIVFLFSYAVGFLGVGIAVALAGYGVWALVAAWGTQCAVHSALLYLATRHPVRPLFWYVEARAQALYGGTVLATNLLNWTIGNIDRVVVGRLMPAHSIGIYATSYNLIYGPTANVLGILQPVFFSASARAVQRDAFDQEHSPLERGFSTLIAAICLYLLPAFLCIAVVSQSLVLALYGNAWAEAAETLRPLALAMPFFLIWGLCTPVLWASGNPGSEFGSQWPVAIAWGLGCWMLARWGGIQAVAWGTLALFILRCSVMILMINRLAGLGLGSIWRAARGGLLISVLMAVVAGLVDGALRASHSSPLLCLAGATLSALVIFVLTLRCAPGLVAAELGALTQRVLERIPSRWAQRLQWLGGKEQTS